MPVARLAATTAVTVRAETIVLLIGPDGRVLAPASALPPAPRRALSDAARALGGDDNHRLPGALIQRQGTVILARTADPHDLESVRRAFGGAVRELTDCRSLAIVPPSDAPKIVAASAEGALLGAYRFTRYRAATTISRVSVVTGSPATRDQRRAVTASGVVADAVALTRDLVNTAPNDLGPADLARAAGDAFADTSVTVKVWDDKALKKGRFGGLTAVGQGSARGPRLVRLTYRPERARTHIALVGKGITFDSGGLSIKPAKSMEWMKADMGGAAAVVGTIKAVAELGLDIALTGWLALAENMPSGTAQRPGDVITIRGGTTVEVLNTDAEGRLVLADALVEASTEKPDRIIDIATLTGAQLIALGSRMAGAMGNDESMRTDVVTAAEAAGEMMWPMPLPAEQRASLNSSVADIANIGDRNGGMLTAGIFLSEFVPTDIPWVHLDSAGPAFNEGSEHDYTPKGGTGFGVRTLVRYLQDATPQHRR